MNKFHIIWNGIFSRQLHQRQFAAVRVHRHFFLKALWRVEPPIKFVILRYVTVDYPSLITTTVTNTRAEADGMARAGAIPCDVGISRWI
jgi:hypothetical protein